MKKNRTILLVCALMSFVVNVYAQSAVQFDQKAHNFGTIPKGDPVSCNFTITNNGTKPLVIEVVNTECGCTTPEYPKEPILKGKSKIIKITYDAEAEGVFKKTITVVYGGGVSASTLVISGKVMDKKKIKIDTMEPLQAGMIAPNFKGIDQDNKLIALSDFLGKKVVIYFYPKDDTPGCTAQACNLRDNYESLQKAGFAIIGVSVDDVTSHKKFEAKYHLPFPLIADVDKVIVNEYGVWGEKSMMGKKYLGITRTTFLIDEKGVIKQIIRKPNTSNHSAEVIAAWGSGL